jgi:hypothetical protein
VEAVEVVAVPLADETKERGDGDKTERFEQAWREKYDEPKIAGPAGSSRSSTCQAWG